MERIKIYVDVTVMNDKYGHIKPLSITWEDGHVYEVDRIKRECRAASTKVGGCGVRYTIMVLGKETFLFHEDDKWFVEGKVPVISQQSNNKSPLK